MSNRQRFTDGKVTAEEASKCRAKRDLINRYASSTPGTQSRLDLRALIDSYDAQGIPTLSQAEVDALAVA
ncbi:MAG: hypothetical protein AB1679_12180 [Actinomycetota bacterium]